MMARRYVVLGGGALGGFYGCRLQRTGLEVAYVLRSDYEHVKTHGWRVDSKDGDFVLPTAEVYDRPEDVPPADVVILALKSTSNDTLKRLLPPLVKDNGVVLVLQNGMLIEEAVADIVGPERVLGGCCFLCSNKIGPGHIHHLDYGTIAMGEFTVAGAPGGITERLENIAKDFQSAQIPIQLADDLRLARWKKLVWNIPFNGLSVILNAQTDEIMRDPDLRLLVREIMDEIVRAAAADGRTIDEPFIDYMLTNTEKMTPYRTSMKVDFDEGRAMEVEAIFGSPLRIAAERGISSPIVASMYRELAFLDRRRQSLRG